MLARKLLSPLYENRHCAARSIFGYSDRSKLIRLDSLPRPIIMEGTNTGRSALVPPFEKLEDGGIIVAEQA